MYMAVGLPILLVGAYFLEPVQKILSDSTDKSLVLHPKVKASSFYAFPFKSYSSQFYSKGKIKVITSNALENMVEIRHHSQSSLKIDNLKIFHQK